MRQVLTLLAVVFLTLAAFGQTPQPQAAVEQIIQRVCQAPRVTSGPEAEQLRRVIAQIAPVLQHDRHKIHVILVASDTVNAWEKDIAPQQSLICVPTAMVHFMGKADGELAFILAHETGHALDDACKSATGRSQIATQSSVLSQLLGTRPSAITEQRACESRADAIGFAIFTRAGYNPFDAAGAFGRLEMYLGDTSTGVLSRLAALGSDHPMTPDRIRHMRQLLAQNLMRGPTGGAAQ